MATKATTLNVVDSSAWLSYFAGDANAKTFSKPIEDIANLIVPSITFTEIFKIVLRQSGEDNALKAIAHMEQGKIVSLNSAIAVDAAKFGIELKLPLADSIIYATGQRFDALIWTQDDDFEELDGVKYLSKVVNK